jgi:hypothetical protein
MIKKIITALSSRRSTQHLLLLALKLNHWRKLQGTSSAAALHQLFHVPIFRFIAIIVQLEIADTGVGMSPEQLHQVWDVPYYTEERVRMYRPRKRAGVGLALLRRLTKLHARGSARHVRTRKGVDLYGIYTGAVGASSAHHSNDGDGISQVR